jgi:Cu2+-containing amine oxidase
LNGADGDTVHRSRHRESVRTAIDPGTSAIDDEVLVSTEASLVWNPIEFTTVEVTDATLRNANGRATAYELLPLVSGIARHREPVTQSDFWVTRYKPGEVLSVNLPSYLDDESLEGQDLVLWYTGSVHHEDGMRDEDANTTPVNWVGFTMEPQNLFAATPMYP